MNTLLQDVYGLPGHRAMDLSLAIDGLCELIEEAMRYGTTQTLEAQYLSLRAQASRAYRDASADPQNDGLLPSGFHGCGFDMVLCPYSLDTLIQGSPKKTLARLRGVQSLLKETATRNR